MFENLTCRIQSFKLWKTELHGFLFNFVSNLLNSLSLSLTLSFSFSLSGYLETSNDLTILFWEMAHPSYMPLAMWPWVVYWPKRSNNGNPTCFPNGLIVLSTSRWSFPAPSFLAFVFTWECLRSSFQDIGCQRLISDTDLSTSAWSSGDLKSDR